MQRILWLVVATAALAACQKSPASKSAATSDASVTPAQANAGPPHRRAGLWETNVSRDGRSSPMGAMKLCVDEAMEAKASALHSAGPVAKNAPCGQPTPTRGLDGSYHFSATCALPDGGRSKIEGVATGDWTNSYHLQVVTDTTGAPIAAMNGHHVMITDGKWLGPCPAGMAGGDMEFANGMKISGGKIAGAAAALSGQ